MIRVSVIVPMYCAKSVMEPCVSALLRQGLEEMEIILVDDCSPDDTYEYACRIYQDNPKIRVLQAAQNGGPGLLMTATGITLSEPCMRKLSAFTPMSMRLQRFT